METSLNYLGAILGPVYSTNVFCLFFAAVLERPCWKKLVLELFSKGNFFWFILCCFADSFLGTIWVSFCQQQKTSQMAKHLLWRQTCFAYSLLLFLWYYSGFFRWTDYTKARKIDDTCHVWQHYFLDTLNNPL